MKQRTPTPQDLVDITEHFRNHRATPEPLTPEQQAVKDAIRDEINAQFDLAQAMWDEEPVTQTTLRPIYKAYKVAAWVIIALFIGFHIYYAAVMVLYGLLLHP